MFVSRTGRAAPFALIATIALVGQARADVLSYDLGKNYEYQQTGPTTAPIPYGSSNAFFFARAFLASPTDYDTGTLTYPGSMSPQSLAPFSYGSPPNYVLGLQTPYLTPAAMNAEYVPGTYQFNLLNSGTAATTSAQLVLPATDLVPAAVPTLTASSYSALQSATAGMAQSVDIQGFTPDPSATGGQTFVTLANLTAGTGVFAAIGIPASTTSVSIPGSAFVAGDSYSLEVIYDNFILGTDLLGGVPSTVRWDNRTLEFFSVAASPVPEPAMIGVFAAGLLALAMSRRARR